MRKSKNFLEKGISANRNLLALIIICLTIGGIIFISYFYFSHSSDLQSQTSERIFSALLPLFATWVGTVLAFYFGRENFEAASNRYEDIIDRVTPDLLDDVLVNQIMVDKKTMVSMELAIAKTKTIKELITFLESVDKNRLPIMNNQEIKYIIHKSTFLEAVTKQPDNQALKFEAFTKIYQQLIEKFLIINEGEVLENVRKQIKSNMEIKDVFIINKQNKVLGWLTDTLIMRYMKE